MNDNKKTDELLSSNYDGIQEYDNDLPKWWVYLFWITIIFGAVYTVGFHFTGADSTDQKLAKDLEKIKSLHETQQSTIVQSSAEDLLKLVSVPERISAGKAVYMERCSPCHAELGQGLVGPNLTDKYWLHGGKITDIRKVIENGVLEKGMLAWKGILSSKQIDEVAVYIHTLKGSSPAGAKAPEGEPYDE